MANKPVLKSFISMLFGTALMAGSTAAFGQTVPLRQADELRITVTKGESKLFTNIAMPLQLGIALNQMRDGKVDNAAETLQKYVDSPAYQSAAPDIRNMCDALLARLYAQLGEKEKAVTYFNKAENNGFGGSYGKTENMPSTYFGLNNEQYFKQLVNDIIAGKLSLKQLEGLRFEAIYYAFLQETEDDDEKAMRFIESLLATGYGKSDPLRPDTYFLSDYINYLIEAGRVTEARAHAETMVHPAFLHTIAAFKSQDAVWDIFEPFPEKNIGRWLDSAASSWVTRASIAHIAYPHRFDALENALWVLRLNGQSKDALELAKFGLELTRELPGDITDEMILKTFPSGDTFFLSYARAAYDVGNYKLGDRLYKFLEKNSGDNKTPFLLDHAGVYLMRGKYKKALKLAQSIPANDEIIEETERQAIIACAAHNMGKIEIRNTAVKQILAEEDEIFEKTFIYLCMDQMDEAKASYLRRLADDDEQIEAYHGLVLTRRSGLSNMKYFKVLRTRAQKISQDPDVKAAISLVGRDLDMHFNALYWHDF